MSSIASVNLASHITQQRVLIVQLFYENRILMRNVYRNIIVYLKGHLNKLLKDFN